MSTKDGIITAINTKIEATNPSIWRIGLTHDLADRKKYWKETEKQSVDHWSAWQADSLSDAQAIEKHFINDKKMKGGTGGDLSPRYIVYVYVF